ncbi:MAG: alpha-galactosidase, partial [Chitinophagaceae bacterium]|nr:alpha-galactosidase [Chitinophagaceae bacterium]
MRIILSLISFALFQCAFAQKFEGLAMTPPMGWNSWNTFATNINAKLVMEIADDMVKSGMKDAGYSYIVLDDGWMAKERDPKTGNLVPDPEKFPDGLEP